MATESMITVLLGRAAERRAIDAAVAAARQGTPSAVVLVGEPGIGKSALLADLHNRYADATFVTAVGFEAEQSIPFAALTTLLAHHGDTLDRLDRNAAHPLRAVTTTPEAPESVPAVALALIELLATLSDTGLVLVVLDDVHWFDPSSRTVIEFALRRLGGTPVATIAASRRSDALDVAGSVVRLGPLDRDSAHALLSAGGTVVEQVSQRCVDLCGGNPLTLVQLAQTLTADQRMGARPLPELLPVAGRLERWLADRIEVLPDRTRSALAALALAGTIAFPLLLEALGELGLHRRDLDPAEAAGIVEIRAAHSSFTHPLFATVAAATVDADTRRAIHRVLAAIVSETSAEREAWHLVEACETPDDVANAVAGLRTLGERAAASGAHLAAADAWQRQAPLLDDPDERARALAAAGSASWDAGRPDLAAPLLRSARELVPAGPTRAMASDVLGQVTGWSESVADARWLLESEVVHVEESRPDLAVALLVSSATLASLAISPDAIELTERAERIAEHADELTRLAARTIGTHVRLMAGEGDAIEDRLTELDALAALIVDGIDRSIIELAQLLAFGLMVRERWDDARSVYATVVSAARAESLGGVETFGLAMSAEVAWRTGRWSQARGEAAVDAAFHARLAGLQGTFGDATMARVEAVLGMDRNAREHAWRAVKRGDELGMHSMSAWGRHALGLADLAVGDARAAVVHLDWIWDLVRRSGATDPGLLWWQGDLLEALVAVGRLDDASRLVVDLAAQAVVTGRRWPAAIAARGRGILAADPAELLRSIAMLDDLDAPFESARSRLLLASVVDGDAAQAQRRNAREVFERLGAMPWIQRSRAEGGTATGAEPTPGQQALAARLTPAELRVAGAVGAGMTSREAAASLALSTRTVDAHLRSIFRKLRISSRSQLAVLVNTSQRDQR
jgi:DNA-binding CsgD family transcriptional regulator